MSTNIAGRMGADCAPLGAWQHQAAAVPDSGRHYTVARGYNRRQQLLDLGKKGVYPSYTLPILLRRSDTPDVEPRWHSKGAVLTARAFPVTFELWGKLTMINRRGPRPQICSRWNAISYRHHP